MTRLPAQVKNPKEAAMIPLLSELARFGRYLFTAESRFTVVQYDSAAAGAVKTLFWVFLSVMACITLKWLTA